MGPVGGVVIAGYMRRFAEPPVGFLAGILLASATTAVIATLSHVASIPNISLLYLPSILATAVYFGTLPSLTAAVLAGLEYDFFLLRPALTFTIAQAQDVLAFATFVLVAVISSQLAAGARARAVAARHNAVESAALYDLARALMTDEIDAVLDAITQRVVHVFEVTLCAVWVPRAAGRLDVAAMTRTGRQSRDRASQGAAEWSYDHGTEVSLPLGSSGRHLFIPLRAGDQTVGVMEVGPRHGQPELDSPAYHLVTSFAAQAALLIARARAADEARRLRILEESDRLKSALLSAVSHDLRTPLAAIKASATSLLLDETDWTRAERRELLRAIDDSADRLNRLVGNLLDLSRIEAGALKPVLDHYSADELIETMRPRLETIAPAHRFSIDVHPGIPPVQVDLVRIEQLLVNLVENAARYAPTGTVIRVYIAAHESELTVRVIDHGPGVPLGARDRIFDTFYRGHPHSDRDPGTGLGLPICRGIVEAHGGALTVEDTPGGGATFVISLPVISAPVPAPL